MSKLLPPAVRTRLYGDHLDTETVFRNQPNVEPEIRGRDRRFLERALKLAQTSEHSGWKIGAIIAKGSRTLAIGINSYRNEPHQVAERLWECSLHAEETAIRSANLRADPDRLAGSTIYVARWNQNNPGQRAQPCVRCQALIDEVGIRRVAWTNAK